MAKSTRAKMRRAKGLVAVDRALSTLIDTVPKLEAAWDRAGPSVKMGIAFGLPFIRGKGRVTKAIAYTVSATQLVPVLAPIVLENDWTRLRLVALLRERPVRTIRVIDSVFRVQHALAAFLPMSRLRLDLVGSTLDDLRIDGLATRVFRRADFSRAVGNGARFHGYFRGADFSESSFQSTAFVGADLSGSSFYRARIEDTTFAIVYAADLETRSVSLTNVSLIETLLPRANLRNVLFHNVVFEACHLDRADFTGATFRNVKFVDVSVKMTKGLPISEDVDATVSFAFDREGTPVFDRPYSVAGAPAMKLARGKDLDGAAGRFADIFGRGTHEERPPVAYRLETLYKHGAVWRGTGWPWKYRTFRRSVLDSAETDLERRVINGLFPRNRALAALAILSAVEASLGDDGLMNELAIADVAPFVDSPFPEIAMVADHRSRVHAYDLPEGPVVVATSGLVVRLIRWGRYSCAWLFPQAVSFDEDEPSRARRTQIRYANLLRESLSMHTDDLEAMPRIQLSGLRAVQAEALFNTWWRFVLLHEAAHVTANPSFPFETGDAEVDADAFATLCLSKIEHLDGDEWMRMSIAELPPEVMHARLRAQGYPDRQIEPATLATYVTYLSASAGWTATAVASLIMLLGHSKGYHSLEHPRVRAERVIELALGSDVRAALCRDFDDSASFLGMLAGIVAEEEADEKVR